MTAAQIVVAAGLPADPALSQLVEFAAKSFSVVLTSLALLAAYCGGVGYLFRRFSPKPLAVRKAAEADDGLTEETVALIAAVVAAVVESPHRIVHIRGLTAEELGWTWGGRMQHHASHKDTHGRHR